MINERHKCINISAAHRSWFEPTPRWVVDSLFSKITKFSHYVSELGVDTTCIKNLVVDVPDLMLSSKLSDQEKALINSKLSQDYANQAVEAQKIIAQVPIRESMEDMVELPAFFNSCRPVLPVIFSEKPYNSACESWANKPRLFWVRKSFADVLVPFFRGLNHIGYIPRIEDSFRPVGVQEGLFKRRYQLVKNEHSDWSHEQILVESMSKTAVTPRLASHKGGAALDFILMDQSCNPVDIGNTYPEGGAIVKIDCPYLTPEQWLNRNIFANTATAMGLNLYPWEDWHVSYRDNLSGYDINTSHQKKDIVAIYGPIIQFDPNSGRILKTYSGTDLDQTFSHL